MMKTSEHKKTDVRLASPDFLEADVAVVTFYFY